MSSLSNLQGCGTALVTPFRADGSLDEPALHGLVHWQIESGIKLLIACGTTGETPTLSDDEWQRVIEVVVETAAGRVPVFAGCTHNSTREAVEKTRRASRIPGLTGLLTANPYYNKPTQEGQFQHFRAIAEATQLPVLLYNIPGRTGANLEPTTVARLAEIPNIIGIKESCGSLPQITELLTIVPPSFKVFAGDDNVALAVIGVGGVGLVSVSANEIPAEMSTMVNAALSGDWITARRINRKYYRLILANFWESNPIPVKCVLARMGRITESYRLPLVPPNPGTRARLEKLAGELGLLTHAPQEPGDLRMY
jgi:4-hydroxy-tetrahydrodipicolinate synthase